MTEQPSTIHIKAYSADDYEITLVMSGTLADVTKKLVEIRAAGFSAHPSEAAQPEQQAIASVMRHMTDSGNMVIAAYPRWQREGKYGEYKFASIYLDSPEDIAQFEAQSGLKINDIPVSDGEAGVRRKYGKSYPKEVAVKRPFDMKRIPDGVNSDGNPRYRYVYVNTLLVSTGLTQAEVLAFVNRWKIESLSTEDLLRALKVSRFGEYKGTIADADEAVTAYIKANLFDQPAQPKAGAPASVQSH
jgi:hypothetical protein